MPNILVVDDDPSVRQMVCDILEFEGHTTRGAADAIGLQRGSYYGAGGYDPRVLDALIRSQALTDTA